MPVALVIIAIILVAAQVKYFGTEIMRVLDVRY